MGRIEQGGLWVHMVERVGRTAGNKENYLQILPNNVALPTSLRRNMGSLPDCH